MRDFTLVLTLAIALGACGPKDQEVKFTIAELAPSPFSGLDRVDLIVRLTDGTVEQQSFPVSNGEKPDIRVTFESDGVSAVTLYGYEGANCVALGTATQGQSGIVFARKETFHSFVAAGTGRRARHSTTLLADGRVLVVSGTNAEVFDPATGTIDTGASPSVPRDSHGAIRLNDGRVLIVGGNSVELYDPANNQFNVVGGLTLQSARTDVPALLEEPGGAIVVAGGVPGTAGTTNAERLDLSVPSVITASGSFENRDAAGTLSSTNDVIVVAGGATATVSGRVETTINGDDVTAGALTTARTRPSIVELESRNAVLVFGGYPDTAEDGNPLNSVESISLSSSVVTSEGTVSELALGQAAAVSMSASGDQILVAGGYQTGVGNVPTDAANIVTWTSSITTEPTGTLQAARAGAHAIRLANSDILISGGVAQGLENIPLYEIYRPQQTCLGLAASPPLE